jgi:ribosomal protein S27AE
MPSACPRCGASALLAGARFCGHCGASLTVSGSGLPQWQRPAPANYSHVVVTHMLSCPECGAPVPTRRLRYTCPRCGTGLVVMPSFQQPHEMKVYVGGRWTALTLLAMWGLLLLLMLGGLVFIGVVLWRLRTLFS